MSPLPHMPQATLARRAARILAAALLCQACQVERVFDIASEPDGAEVRIDDTVVGYTPERVPFDHYGTRRFTFYKEGSLTTSAVHNLRAPWYAHFPFDVVSEVLLGWAWSDVRRIEAQLPSERGRMTQVDIEGLLQRAESLRRAGPSGPRGSASAQAADESGSSDLAAP